MKKVHEFIGITEKEISELAESIKNELPCPSCLLLSGEMASGKTSFSVAFCRLFGISVSQSPTYAIHQRYISIDKKVIDHFDFYRLSSPEELESTGVSELLRMPSEYKLLEWSERLDPEELESLGTPIYKLEIVQNENGKSRDYILSLKA